MNADGNKDTLLSENGEAQSTSYGSFEDIAEDCTSPFIEIRDGSQTDTIENHEMGQVNHNAKATGVEDGTQAAFLSDSQNPSPGTSTCKPNRAVLCDQELPFRMDEVDGIKAESPKYMRISASVQDLKIKDHLLGMWPDGILPELVITFLGGCDESFISEEVKECLSDCITSILGKLNCCLFTRGSYVGITKLIGSICSTETLEWNYGYTSKSIGIMPWPLVHGLIDEALSFPGYNFKIQEDKRAGEQGAKNWPLDPNQHFYYLVDEGNGENSGMEIEFISKLNMTLCKDFYPCIMLLTGGGLSSLKAIEKVFSEKTDDATKPVLIIINKSGKLADFLSGIFYYYDKNTKPDIESAIKSASEKNSGYPIDDIIKDTNYKEMIHEFMTNKKDLIFVFELENAKEDLQSLLFRAAKKATEKFIRSQFLFAFHLGDSNLVKELSRKDPWLAFHLMTNSLLISNSLTRVRELLEKYEFDVQGFVHDRLLSLYELPNEERPREPDAQATVSDIRVRVAVSELNPEDLIKIFRQRYMREDEVSGKKVKSLKIDEVLKFLSNENIRNDIHNYKINEVDNGVHEVQIDVNEQTINPIQALVINSVLFLNVNAAKLLWYFDQYHPLSNALLVYTLLNGIKQNAKAVSKSSESNFEDIMNYFESLMCFLLNNYFKTSQEMTEKVLTSRIPLWRNQTLIEVAGDIGLKHFIGSPGSRAVLEKQWSEVDDEKFKNSCWKAVCKPFAPIFAVPKFKLIIHVIVYVISLIAFAVYVLSPHTFATEIIKWIVLIIMASLLLDEVRQISDGGKSLYRNLKQWAWNLWNILDVLAIMLFAVGIGLSFTQKYSSNCVLLVYLAVSFFNILQFLRAMEFLGVYIVMIRKMLMRMKTFLVVVVVSIVAYGIFMAGMLHPRFDSVGATMFNILFRPYLLLVGEAGIESFELSNTTTVFGTNKVSSVSEILVVIAMAAFLVFGNILLMNLLIADFSHIHGEVLSQSEETWMYEQFILLQEFKKKPFLPIPFSIFENCYYLFRLCCKRRTDRGITAAADKDRRKIADFERFCFKKCFPKIPKTFEKTSYAMEGIYENNIPCAVHRSMQRRC